jgi:BirA family biotin operon repressor/biotin-[acetyl-CoA-carboxylase] ligase
MDSQLELDLARLEALLRTSAIGYAVDHHRAVESTMPLAHLLAQNPDIGSGHIVVAEQQSAGKGRSGRTWLAPYARALLVSVILKPPWIPDVAAQIPMAAGNAVADALVEAAPELDTQVSLKWPNDVLLGRGHDALKVAGILSESVYDGAQPAYAILGIGVNVNQAADELPTVDPRMLAPVSLRLFLGRSMDRTALLAVLCQQLARQMSPDRNSDAIFDDWRARLSTLGQTVSVLVHAGPGSEEVRGVAVDVSPDGALRVRDGRGRIHSFRAGDVSVRGEA